jgi:hypothetical protein
MCCRGVAVTHLCVRVHVCAPRSSASFLSARTLPSCNNALTAVPQPRTES